MVAFKLFTDEQVKSLIGCPPNMGWKWMSKLSSSPTLYGRLFWCDNIALRAYMCCYTAHPQQHNVVCTKACLHKAFLRPYTHPLNYSTLSFYFHLNFYCVRLSLASISALFLWHNNIWVCALLSRFIAKSNKFMIFRASHRLLLTGGWSIVNPKRWTSGYDE